MAHSTQRPHVLILGAGLGGLTLAQTLRKQGISYEIFERDESIDARFEGWCISLHDILPDLMSDLPDDIPSLEKTNHLLPLENESGMTIYIEGKPPSHLGYGKIPYLRANRRLLREYLAANIPIQWDKHLNQIEESESAVTLKFVDGTSATGDILVGADGVNSKVRHHILENMDELSVLPTTQIIGTATLNRYQLERQMKLGTSAYIIRKPAYRFFVGLRQVEEDAKHAEFYWLWTQVDRDDAHGTFWPQTATKLEQYEYVMSSAKDLEPEYAEILKLSKPEDIHMPPLVLRDLIVNKMPNSRITLLGDAIHPMTPFRGEGGNQAMRDAIYLGRLLAKATSNNVKECLKQYQEEMLPRGATAVDRSRNVLFQELA